jgi:surface polysaccharide O-acyltransferase-like enzyme
MIDWSQLVNLQKYTPLELILFGGGCYMWVVVYVLYIRSIFKKKFIEAPIFGVCGNIGWEFTWSFLASTDMGPLLQWCYRIWFFFDLLIFYGVLRYGWEQVRTEAFRKVLQPLLVISAVFQGTVFYLMHNSGLDTPIGANSAFLLNFYLSVLYVFVLFQQRELGNLGRVSWVVAWLKMIGTGTNTVFMNIHAEYADNHFLHFLTIATTTVDCVYIYLVWKLKRQARAASSVPASIRSAVSNPSENVA